MCVHTCSGHGDWTREPASCRAARLLLWAASRLLRAGRLTLPHGVTLRSPTARLYGLLGHGAGALASAGLLEPTPSHAVFHSVARHWQRGSRRTVGGVSSEGLPESRRHGLALRSEVPPPGSSLCPELAGGSCALPCPRRRPHGCRGKGCGWLWHLQLALTSPGHRLPRASPL